MLITADKIKILIKMLVLIIVTASVIQTGFFSVNQASTIEALNEAALFFLFVALLTGTLFFKTRNNRRMIVEFAMSVALYYYLYYGVLIPLLYPLGPYIVAWADVLAGLPVIWYYYSRTWLTTKLLTAIGPHCYVQDKYLNLLAAPLYRSYRRRGLARALLSPNVFKAVIAGMAALRENGALQHSIKGTVAATRTNRFVLFCCGFLFVSQTIDIAFATWCVEYAQAHNIPFQDGSIWEVIQANNGIDWFSVRDLFQNALSAFFPFVVMYFVYRDNQTSQ